MEPHCNLTCGGQRKLEYIISEGGKHIAGSLTFWYACLSSTSSALAVTDIVVGLKERSVTFQYEWLPGPAESHSKELDTNVKAR